MVHDFDLATVEQLFDCLSDVVYCIKDTQCTYQSVNLAFVLRVDAEEKSDLIGKQAGDIFPQALAEVYQAQDQIVLNEARSIQDQLEQITNSDGGTGWYLANKFPITGPDQRVIGLVGISQDLHTPSDSDLELANLKTVVEFIKSHLDQPLKTEELAARISLSSTQLDHRMKRVFRLSTKKFIIKCRLEEASRRLACTDQSLAEIAMICGFSDQSALTRQFRSATRLTPSSYRKKHTPES